ncbi:MAG: Alkaline phosphatase synthesis transcriptional regulatory protein SphR [Planctomycetes bacterium]|nr:Alkaline phosphatase synthesis transcriptional regulatory protein SphR [Planctomycetota bacterium]
MQTTLNSQARATPLPYNGRMLRTVLVIEDDAAIRRGVVDALKFEGFTALEAADGEAGLKSALQVDCDLVLLDLALPKLHGLEILREVRRVRPTLPVIVLTAMGNEKDRVAGLKLGADDYVVKPFSVVELMARVEAVMRRSPERPQDVQEYEFAEGVADLARCEIRYHDGTRTELSERERELLRYFVVNPGRAISRDEILSRVWRIDPSGISTRTIDMHVARLRDKLRDSGDDPRILLTVRGKGYMLAVAP